MKKITLLNFILLTTCSIFSQEVKQDSVPKTPFNQWTMEFSIGDSKGIQPYSPGYYYSNPNTFFGHININNFSIGARYMIGPKFGFKADLSYSNIENANQGNSLPFKMQILGLSAQGVVNLGQVLDFNKYTKRLGLLAHAGVKLDQMTSKTEAIANDHNYGIKDYSYGIVYGITPQFRIGERTALQLDLSLQNNFRQHLNWDGSTADSSNNLRGRLITTSLGITYSLGKEKLHGDWTVVKEENTSDKEELKRMQKSIEEIQTLMNDTDKDGVPDYLDTENNSIAGAVVDTRGKMLDLNKNGVPDEMEKKPKPFENAADVNSDMIKKMINQDYFVINFETGKIQPNKASTDNLNNIFLLLKNNPDVSVYIIGYADDKNLTAKNEVLSKERAENIKSMLVKAGINNQRLTPTNSTEGLVKQLETDNSSKNLKRVLFRLK